MHLTDSEALSRAGNALECLEEQRDTYSSSRLHHSIISNGRLVFKILPDHHELQLILTRLESRVPISCVPVSCVPETSALTRGSFAIKEACQLRFRHGKAPNCGVTGAGKTSFPRG
jgi:hypothetical protein